MESLLKRVPSWLSSIAIFVFVAMLVHSTYISKKPFQIWGKAFGAIEKPDVGTLSSATNSGLMTTGIVIASWKICTELGAGWSDFHPGQGRMIVGAGNPINDPYKKGLRARDAWKPSMVTPPNSTIGGAEFVALTEQQVPGHSHSMFSNNIGFQKQPGGRNYIAAEVGYGSDIDLPDVGKNTPPQFSYKLIQGFNWPSIGRTSVFGGISGEMETRADAHPNMPPYIALYLCKKT